MVSWWGVCGQGRAAYYGMDSAARLHRAQPKAKKEDTSTLFLPPLTFTGLLLPLQVHMVETLGLSYWVFVFWERGSHPT